MLRGDERRKLALALRAWRVHLDSRGVLGPGVDTYDIMSNRHVKVCGYVDFMDMFDDMRLRSR